MSAHATASEFARRQSSSRVVQRAIGGVGAVLTPLVGLTVVHGMPERRVALALLAFYLPFSALVFARIYRARKTGEFSGQIRRPNRAWIIEQIDGELRIDTGAELLTVNLADVQTRRLVRNNTPAWMGLENEVLELTLPDGARLIVPGSSIGFGDIIPHAESRPSDAVLSLTLSHRRALTLHRDATG